jgi:hypothetical protein
LSVAVFDFKDLVQSQTESKRGRGTMMAQGSGLCCRFILIDLRLIQSKFGLNASRLLFGVIGIVAFMALSGCGLERQAEFASFDKQVTEDKVVLRSQIDSFDTVIETERWTVIMENALEGARLSQNQSPDLDEDDLIRIDRALRTGVRHLIMLRDELCMAGMEPEKSCQALEIPQWALLPPDRVTSLNEYTHRSQWLGNQIGDLSEIGCAAGKPFDEYICAVE